MRDQLTGLAYALLFTGLLLTPLEFLILKREDFWDTSPYLIGPLVAGILLIIWLRLTGARGVKTSQQLSRKTQNHRQPDARQSG